MIAYTQTQVTFFNTVEEFHAYIDEQKASNKMTADVHTGLKINGVCQEKLSVANMPSTKVHSVVDEARLSIGSP
jgi:hypothetical protein